MFKVGDIVVYPVHGVARITEIRSVKIGDGDQLCHIYQKFISDLAGYDPMEHDGTPQTVIPQVISWLATRPDAIRTPTPLEVLGALSLFQEARERLSSQWSGRSPWPHLLRTGLQVAKETGLIVLEMEI